MIHSPEFWSVGHLVTKTQTSRLSWKTQVCGTTVRENAVPKDAVLQTIMNFSMRSEDEKYTNQKVQSCLACEHGINVNLGRKHTFDCRQDNASLFRNRQRLWTVKFDADGRVLKRYEH